MKSLKNAAANADAAAPTKKDTKKMKSLKNAAANADAAAPTKKDMKKLKAVKNLKDKKGLKLLRAFKKAAALADAAAQRKKLAVPLSDDYKGLYELDDLDEAVSWHLALAEQGAEWVEIRARYPTWLDELVRRLLWKEGNASRFNETFKLTDLSENLHKLVTKGLRAYARFEIQDGGRMQIVFEPTGGLEQWQLCSSELLDESPFPFHLSLGWLDHDLQTVADSLLLWNNEAAGVVFLLQPTYVSGSLVVSFVCPELPPQVQELRNHDVTHGDDYSVSM
jgi:hypothetical protein